MNRIILFVIGILVGLGAGWYFGYTRPVARDHRKLLTEYQKLTNHLQLSDSDIADFAAHHREYFEASKRQDEIAAAIALGVFRRLEKGEIEEAKTNLAATVAIYYRDHRQDGNSNLLTRIERYASTNTGIANALRSTNAIYWTNK